MSDDSNRKAKILDGKALANELNASLRIEIEELKSKTGIIPCLATILVGDDPASEVYVKIKHRTCQEVGINSEMIRFNADVKAKSIEKKISKLNSNPNIHGILLQLPLPQKLKSHTNTLLQQIECEKDVDGFTYTNRGQLFYIQEILAPCTPKGIIKLLGSYDVDLQGKDVTIVNHSNLLGKPLMLMTLNRNATVSVCHIHTKEIIPYTSQADILVVGVGKPNFIKKHMIKEGAIVIDVGINRVGDKLTGDVDFDDVFEKCSRITPVPGGVGPLTVAMLMRNTVIAYKMQLNEK